MLDGILLLLLLVYFPEAPFKPFQKPYDKTFGFPIRTATEQILNGFGCRPVFRVEDTKGEPLEYENIELPDLPFIERAQQWGISVKAIPGNYRYFGYYSPCRKEIAIANS